MLLVLNMLTMSTSELNWRSLIRWPDFPEPHWQINVAHWNAKKVQNCQKFEKLLLQNMLTILNSWHFRSTKTAWNSALKGCLDIWAKFNDTLRTNGTKHMVLLMSCRTHVFNFTKKADKHSQHLHKFTEFFYEVVDFFVLDTFSKPIFCSKVA